MRNDKLATYTARTRYGRLFDWMIHEVLPPLDLENGPWIAGGAVRRLVEGQQDYTGFDLDIWFKDEKQLQEWTKWMIGPENSVRNPSTVSVTDNADTYCVTVDNKKVILQFIKYKFFKNSFDLLESFDFSMSQCLTDGKELITTEDGFDDIMNRKLTFRHIELDSAVGCVKRIGKFMAAGYKISNYDVSEVLRAVLRNPESVSNHPISDDIYEREQELQA